MSENKDKLYLERILEAIQKIDIYIVGFEFSYFEPNTKTIDAVLMQFVNIGEMINRLSDDFREKHHDLTWHAAIGMRNEIVHGYFNIKPEVVWKTAKDDLPILKKQIQKLLKSPADLK